MIANQLNTTNNTIGSLFPNGPISANVLKYNGGWSVYQFDPDDLTWYPDSLATLNPGEAAMFKSPTASTLTFVGEVLQGALSGPVLIAGSSVARSSMVPQAGLVQTDLGYPAEPGDTILKWTGSWSSAQFDPDDLTFYPSQPTFAVGEGMMIKKSVSATVTSWTRNFTVQ